MPTAASKPVVNDDSAIMNDDAATQDAIARGFTVRDFLVRYVTDAIRGVWAALAYVAAHRAAGASRDTILVSLASAGISADNASEYIGANAGAFAQRAEAIGVLAHAGIDLSHADAFADEDTLTRLNLVSWRTAYDARDVVYAAPAGRKAWDALTRFQNADADARKAHVVTAREKAVTVAQKAVEALPETATDADRKAAEKAAEKAEKALARARKSATPRSQSDYTVEFAKADYDALTDALNAYNGDKKGKARLTMSEFIRVAVDYLVTATADATRAPRARKSTTA